MVEYQSTLTVLAVIGMVIAVIVACFRNTPARRRQHGYRVARVHRVIDGDTVVIATGWRKLTIRLDSIDCPEYGQYWGDIAKYGLIKMIRGRRIRFEEHAQDKYGRTLATIYVQQNDGAEWINVNERMVTLGHAWVSRHLYSHLPKDRQNELNWLERWARSKRIGLWKDADAVPPWKYRGNSG